VQQWTSSVDPSKSPVARINYLRRDFLSSPAHVTYTMTKALRGQSAGNGPVHSDSRRGHFITGEKTTSQK
ncbi:hypothetical protein Bpfe_009233, partial [Biomphalaria pfeifferi]